MIQCLTAGEIKKTQGREMLCPGSHSDPESESELQSGSAALHSSVIIQGGLRIPHALVWWTWQRFL